MGDALRVCFGLALTVAVIAVGVFFVRVMYEVNPEDPESTNRDKGPVWLSNLRMGLVAVGWFAVVSLGVYGVLALYLRHWDEFIWMVAGLAAFGTFPVLMKLAVLTRLQHDYDVLAQAGAWERKQLGYWTTPTEGAIEGLLEDSQDLRKSALERSVAATSHGFAAALRARDQRMEAAVLKRVAQEHQERQDREAKVLEEAARAASAAAARAAELEDEQRLLQSLASRLEVWPVTDKHDQRLDETTKALALAPALVQELWRDFKARVADPVPTTPDEASETARGLKGRLQGLDGVLIPSAFEPVVLYSGNPLNGYCDPVVRDGDGALAMYKRLQYTETVPGLVSALFFAAALPRRWSWGHGYYDRDAELIISPDRLNSLLKYELRGEPLGGAERWPPPGVRLVRLDDGYAVACLAIRPGRGLYDVSLQIRNGMAGTLQVSDVFIWGQGVLY